MIGRGRKVPTTATYEVLKEFDLFHRQWRISFDYFLLHEQDHLTTDGARECIPIFHLQYKNAKWGKNPIVNKFCIVGKDLRVQTIPSKAGYFFPPARNVEWKVGKWTNVELKVFQEPDGVFYLTFSVDGEIVSQTEVCDTCFYRLDTVREMKAYLGCDLGPYSPNQFEHCGPLNVYIDNFEMETWEEDVFAGEAENIPYDGRCMEGWTPAYDICFRVFNASGTWDHARKNCQKIGTELARIDNFLVDSDISSKEEDSARMWINGKFDRGENIWKDAAGKPLTYWNHRYTTTENWNTYGTTANEIGFMPPGHAPNNVGDYCLHYSTRDYKHESEYHSNTDRTFRNKKCSNMIDHYVCSHKRFSKYFWVFL